MRAHLVINARELGTEKSASKKTHIKEAPTSVSSFKRRRRLAGSPGAGTAGAERRPPTSKPSKSDMIKHQPSDCAASDSNQNCCGLLFIVAELCYYLFCVAYTGLYSGRAMGPMLQINRGIVDLVQYVTP